MAYDIFISPHTKHLKDTEIDRDSSSYVTNEETDSRRLSACPWVISQLSEAGLGLNSLLAVLASVHALGYSCSTVLTRAFEASDLFLSRLFTEMLLMDLPHF